MEGKREECSPWVDDTIESYITIIDLDTTGPDYPNIQDGKEYSLKTDVQIVAMGATRLIYYISSHPLDDKKYYKSLKEVEKITGDIWGEEKGDVHWCNYLYNTNRGMAKINNEYKLIYHFDMNYLFPIENKVHIRGVIDNTIINKEYDIDSPNVIKEIRNYFNGLKKDGVYITKSQKKDINEVLDRVKDGIKKMFEEVIDYKQTIKKDKVSRIRVIWKGKTPMDPKGWLRYSLRVNGKTVIKSVGVSGIEKKHFDTTTQRIDTTHPNHEEINKKIEEDIVELKRTHQPNFLIVEEPIIYKESQTYLMKNKRNGLYKIGKSTMPAYRELYKLRNQK